MWTYVIVRNIFKQQSTEDHEWIILSNGGGKKKEYIDIIVSSAETP